MTETFNKIFAMHSGLEALKQCVLIPLNKDNGKGDKVDNLRPLSMVNLERKALSNVVLERTSDKLVDTISPNQSEFREGRSTADIIWTYRWIIALAEKYDY